MSVNKIILTQDSTTIDSESNYGVVTLEVSNLQSKETANIVTQQWNGENGDEVYIPDTGVVFKSYDVTFKLGVKATLIQSARTRKESFIEAIKNGLWQINISYYNLYLNGCYLVKEEPDDEGEDWVTFKVTFKVTNP